MNNCFAFLCVVMLYANHLFSQVSPGENKILNYRIIKFEAPVPANGIYVLEIAAGNIHSADSFARNIVLTRQADTRTMVGKVPSFDRQYTWRIRYGSGGRTATPLYHFSTGAIPEIDAATSRVRILSPHKGDNPGYIFMDGCRALFDLDGQPIWYLPLIEGKPLTPNDLKITSRGTITFLAPDLYEINFDGDVLWHAKSGVTSVGRDQNFHHNFTRLSNGHYMALGRGTTSSPALAGNPSPDGSMAAIPQTCRISQCSSLIEFDETGTEVWCWKASGYFDGRVQPGVYETSGNVSDVHENAFWFDEQHNEIYVSCKGISTLLKVKYPEGTVLAEYNAFNNTGLTASGELMFSGQHCLNGSSDGSLLLFDNNLCGSGIPLIKSFRMPGGTNTRPTLLWQYQCNTDGTPPGSFFSGGSVQELTNGNLLVCMAGRYSKVFEVNRNGVEQWSMLPERKNENGTWENVHLYRASYVTEAELMQMVNGVATPGPRLMPPFSLSTY